MLTIAADSLALPIPIQIKRSFRDSFERRAYVRAYLLACRLLEEPALVHAGRAYLDRFIATDPRQQQIYRMWTYALDQPVEDLIRDLLTDSAAGAALRESAPVFTVVPASEIRALDRAIS